MATQWIRWNTVTHIFELSTDGVNFNPLSLDAAILTEGSVPDARLSANIPRKDAQNVFSHARPIDIASASPVLDFNESDEAADAKRWRLFMESQLFKLQRVNDAYNTFVDLMEMSRTGIMTVTPSVAGTHRFTGNVTGINRLEVRNSGAGAGNAAELALGNDMSATRALLRALASNFTPSGSSLADTLAMVSSGLGGISIDASDASGAIRFYTGGVTTPRLTLTAGGAANFSGDISGGNITAGLVNGVDVAALNTRVGVVEGFFSSAPQAYSPAWTSTGTNPTIGNGTITGIYREMNKLVYAEVTILLGSTTNPGTGEYRFSLPFNAQGSPLGTGYMRNAGINIYVGVVQRMSPNTIALIVDGAIRVTSTSPFTFGQDDEITFSILYNKE